MDHCTKNHEFWTSWGPTIIFSEHFFPTFELLYTWTYFWALFGANIRNIIRNINVQSEGGEGGSKAVWTMLKTQTIWLGRVSLTISCKTLLLCLTKNYKNPNETFSFWGFVHHCEWFEKSILSTLHEIGGGLLLSPRHLSDETSFQKDLKINL